MNIRLINYTAYPFHGYGGAELYLYNYAKTLVKNGHTVEIVCNSYDDNIKNQSTFSGISYTFIGRPFYGKFKKLNNQDGYIRKSYKKSRFAGFLNRFVFWIGLLKYQLKNPSEFVHAFSDCGFIYTFFRKLYLISTVFDIENRGLKKLGLWGILVPIRAFYYSATTTRIIKKSTIVTSGGEDNSNELIDIFACNANKIKILSNALDKKYIEKFSANQPLNNNITTDQGISLISIGRLEQLKNPLLLLDVFKLVIKKNQFKCKLNIIGDGPLKSEVIKKIDEINFQYPNSVSLQSNVKEEDKMQRLIDSDLYINLAETRYMLLVVMEAMVCSLPVFTSYPLDGVVKEKVNGIIFNSESPNEIADRLSKYINENDLESMGRESYKIIKKYTWENTARQGEVMYSGAHLPATNVSKI